jgi:hypothetical protein
MKINNRTPIHDTHFYKDSVQFKKLNNYYLEFSASGYGYGNGSLLGLIGTH